MSEENKHWREDDDDKFLGSWQFADKEVKTFTIKSYGREAVTGSNGKTDQLRVVHFTDGKPMIINKTNGKAIEAALKTGITSKWIGQTISIHVIPVRFGAGMVDGMRVIIAPSKASAPVKTAVLPALKKGSKEWLSIVGWLTDGSNSEKEFEGLYANVLKKYKVTAILKKQLKKEHDGL